jgi:putative endonuclease
MLKGMQRKKESRVEASREEWALYILECGDGTLYTGITKDLERRIAQHNAGRASRYTRVRRPVRLMYHERCGTRTAALVRECEVKEMTRKAKFSLIKNFSP